MLTGNCLTEKSKLLGVVDVFVVGFVVGVVAVKAGVKLSFCHHTDNDGSKRTLHTAVHPATGHISWTYNPLRSLPKF